MHSATTAFEHKVVMLKKQPGYLLLGLLTV